MVGSSRIGVDESINDHAGRRRRNINELLTRKRRLEQPSKMVGDLPDADVAPENVLFNNKLILSPTTTTPEIISTGSVRLFASEVITGQEVSGSQYAFVELKTRLRVSRPTLRWTTC